MSTTTQDQPRMLTVGEVAVLFGVDPKTAGRWAATGRISCQRTLGGHRRFFASEVAKLAAERTSQCEVTA